MHAVSIPNAGALAKSSGKIRLRRNCEGDGPGPLRRRRKCASASIAPGSDVQVRALAVFDERVAHALAASYPILGPVGSDEIVSRLLKVFSNEINCHLGIATQ